VGTGNVVWAITAYYNPVRYGRRLSNYKIFREKLAAPLVAIELTFDGKFDLTEGDADILIQLCGGALVWQKERLLNLALRAVPADVEHVAWLDCDVILKKNDWALEARKHLQDQNVVQLFSEAVFIDSHDYIQRSERNGSTYVPGLLSLAGAKDLISVGSTIEKKVVRYVPGFAWAAKRSLFTTHGFYDGAIVGSGDSLMAAAMLGQHESISRRYSFSEARRRHYFGWALPFNKSVAGRVGYVPGTIFHLKHGEVENRGYVDRQKGLAGFDFDPDIDLRIGQNGAWDWARPRPDLESFIRKYFMSRAEDG